MRTNETVRSRTLYHATLRKMLALGCAALLLLGSMLGSVVFMLTYHSSRQSARTAVENAAENMNLWVASINNISSMIAYGNVAQHALENYWHSGGTADVENMHTLFASAGQYIRVIDNFILLDNHCSYYNSMFVVPSQECRQLTDFVLSLPAEQKNGRAFWYILPDGKVVLVRSIYSLNATMHTLGYLLITMDLQQLYAIARQYAFHDSSRLYLLDSDGSLLYGPSGTDDVPPEGLLDETDAKFITIDGNSVLAAHSRVLDNSWILIELTPQNLVFAGVFQLLGWSILLFCLAMALFMLVILYISRSLTAPFQKMGQAMEQIEKGDFAIPKICGVGILEIDQLLHRFGQMAERLDQTIEEVYRSRLREKELALSAQQSEIEMLQQQINPHFLYNTLDSINWMASFGATEEVSRMIVALSDFFHFTVSEHSIFTTVGQEVAFAKNYVYLQQCRFGMALQVHFDVKPDTENNLTLRLLLQPLIENAIVHGVMSSTSGGTVRIWIAREHGQLHLHVEDNGAGMDDETLNQLRTTGGARSIGLPNIMRRLELVYGGHHTFSIDSTPGQGTQVDIIFPAVRTQEELRELTNFAGGNNRI